MTHTCRRGRRTMGPHRQRSGPGVRWQGLRRGIARVSERAWVGDRCGPPVAVRRTSGQGRRMTNSPYTRFTEAFLDFVSGTSFRFTPEPPSRARIAPGFSKWWTQSVRLDSSPTSAAIADGVGTRVGSPHREASDWAVVSAIPDRPRRPGTTRRNSRAGARSGGPRRR